MAPVAEEMKEFSDIFEGPEKTLTLCFRSRRLAVKSLRLIPREEWAKVLQHAKCEILSECESAPVTSPNKDKDKRVPRGLTAYLLSESSLFVGDTSLVLKTCGTTTPLMALEPLLDLAVPTWRKREAKEYLKYATFQRLGYMRPEEQIEVHTSWENEIEHMDKHFTGESLILGSRATSMQHVYVANYLPRDEVMDVFSTQVALTKLEPTESLLRFGGGEKRNAVGAEDFIGGNNPLRDAWVPLHGDEPRSLAAFPQLDEKFFEPIGYSANGVFGKHFTTVHITPQESCSYLSVETTAPLNRDARRRFILGAEGMCSAKTLTVCEFALCSTLFSGAAPAVPGFEVVRSSQTVGHTFACAHHHYERVPAGSSANGSARISSNPSPTLTCSSQASPMPSPHLRSVAMGLEAVEEVGEFSLVEQDFPQMTLAEAVENLGGPNTTAKAAKREVHIVEVSDTSRAHVNAAEAFLGAAHTCGIPEKDVPMNLLDVSELRRQADVWQQLLPRVEPFYAVKCNADPDILETLWCLWQERGQGGFDVASPFEIQRILDLGADPGANIIYANPCKQASAVSFARRNGVRRVVFDNSAELAKLQELWPEAELVLRVQTDDEETQCPLSNKFGCAPEDCAGLLTQAKNLGLKVVGVSFHVGSGCSQVGAFRGAIKRARDAFEEAERQGFTPGLLDIGGGFPGWDEEGQATFADHAADIREMLDELFPSPDIQVIGEPGRFFAAKAMSVLTTVVSVAEGSLGNRYYLNDGLYGSFNCLVYDHATLPRPKILRDGRAISDEEAGAMSACTIFGPTCDGFDKLSDTMALPRLRVGDRLLFEQLGAYTASASTSFNGFEPASSFVFKAEVRSVGLDTTRQH